MMISKDQPRGHPPRRSKFLCGHHTKPNLAERIFSIQGDNRGPQSLLETKYKIKGKLNRAMKQDKWKSEDIYKMGQCRKQANETCQKVKY